MNRSSIPEGVMLIWDEYSLPSNPRAAIQTEEDLAIFEDVADMIVPDGRLKVTHEIWLDE